MSIDDEIKNERLQYNINRETAKYQHYLLQKLVNMNMLQAKKYYLLIKEE